MENQNEIDLFETDRSKFLENQELFENCEAELDRSASPTEEDIEFQENELERFLRG